MTGHVHNRHRREIGIGEPLTRNMCNRVWRTFVSGANRHDPFDKPCGIDCVIRAKSDFSQGLVAQCDRGGCLVQGGPYASKIRGQVPNHEVTAKDPRGIGVVKFGIGVGHCPVAIPRQCLPCDQLDSAQCLSAVAFDRIPPQRCDGPHLLTFRRFGVVRSLVFAREALTNVAKDIRLRAVAGHNQILLNERDRVVRDPVDD